MEDRAPINTTQVSNNWKQSKNIHKLQWPENSPNLNPIENVWFKMKHMVSNLSNPNTMEELKEAVNSSWEEIPFENLDNVLVSLPHQMKNVVNANVAPVQW
ncbi:hypothetical protein O181_002580 [Austropuccinia psidii MF-1]|uniref:Tc1-like transposase DDE domain-containing protein n=1 Tax=Austropuccinia psidii MF-1 TaxID=1389203 RepID=A0A9Q3GD00_9BASI|nr:hypothetical protein [Austropuccinia psidii MF-1]